MQVYRIWHRPTYCGWRTDAHLCINSLNNNNLTVHYFYRTQKENQRRPIFGITEMGRTPYPTYQTWRDATLLPSNTVEMRSRTRPTVSMHCQLETPVNVWWQVSYKCLCTSQQKIWIIYNMDIYIYQIDIELIYRTHTCQCKCYYSLVSPTFMITNWNTSFFYFLVSIGGHGLGEFFKKHYWPLYIFNVKIHGY